MSKIFIFANSFNATTIINNIKYIFTIPINEVVLLKENHDIKDFNIENIKVSLYENIDMCIQNCNKVIIIKDDYLPDNNINYVIKKCKKNDIQLIMLNEENKYNNSLPLDTIDKINRKPIILHLFTGTISAHFCVEIMLNKIFSELNISFTQFFSNNTTNYLKQLDKQKVLNQNLSKQCNNNTLNTSLIIISLDIGKTLQEIISKLDLIRKINSDFLILNADINFSNEKKILNILNYGCMKKNDYIIKSNYFYYENLFPIFCNDNKNIHFVFNPLLENNLKHKILSKITLPNSIKRI